MARLARIVIPGVAHHVTQRGNRRLPIFFSADDRLVYLRLLHEGCAAAGVSCLAWCLMDNHVHLVLVPGTADGLRAALAEAHRRYTRAINFREGWRGFLIQGRFASYPMDDQHMMAAVRYVERNPVAARLVDRAEDWRWCYGDTSDNPETGGAGVAVIEFAHVPPAAHGYSWRAASCDAARQSARADVLRG